MNPENTVVANCRIGRRLFCLGVGALLLSPNLCHGRKRMPARPFVKWVGGKGQLLDQLTVLLPKDLGTMDNLVYVEPFVGGGAMLFHVLQTFPNLKHAIVNDLNADLVTAYKVVRDKPDELVAALSVLQNRYRKCKDEAERKAMFVAERERYNERTGNNVEVASLFIFLNRTCFNGMYRVNAKGKYNVPFGKAVNPLICDKETVYADSALLRKVEILNGDFECVMPHVKGKAFFYFDPPYRPLTQTASFTAYSKEGFGDDEQRRLAKFCRKLDAQGQRWLLSNSDPHNVDKSDDFFDELYSGYEIRRVFANRMINSKAEGRGKVTELAIRNYGE